MDNTTHETIKCLITRKVYNNSEDGFTIYAAKINNRNITLLTYIPYLQPEQPVTACGSWTNSPKYGLQFKVDSISEEPTNTKEGVLLYLSSGVIKGIGPATARKIVDIFGKGTMNILDSEPERLTEIPGIGMSKVEIIKKSWNEQQSIRKVMMFLQDYGIRNARAAKIFKMYGNSAIDKIKENPYCLANDIKGIGFISADDMAMKMGLPSDHSMRLRSGLLYTLSEEIKSGHCAVSLDKLISKTAKLLIEKRPEHLPEENLYFALDIEEQVGKVSVCDIESETYIYPSWLFRAEKGIASHAKRLLSQPLPWKTKNIDSEIKTVEENLKITLAAGQKLAISTALASKFAIITGGPGVGKTTILRSLLTIVSKFNINIALAAPTGRAAKRMSETTGMEAKTIHRLLEYTKKGFARNTSNPLECSMLLIDECSMLDVPLMNSLLSAVPSHAAVVLIGDVDQLPSVGPGQVLADFINSGAIPVVRLTEIFRQSADSDIIVNAHRINKGNMPNLSKNTGDFLFIQADTPEDCAQTVVSMVNDKIPAMLGINPLIDIQVLCPMNRGTTGTESLNIALQAKVTSRHGPEVQRGGYKFAIGEKVMQTENNYDKDVFNGDMGYITNISPEDSTVIVTFDDRQVIYDYGEIDSLVPAYAISIHKSQGSEFPVVVIPVTTQHYPMLQKNLIYTGVTRGKKLVVLVGQKKALAIAIKGHGNTSSRISNLKEWLNSSQEPVKYEPTKAKPTALQLQF